MRPTDSAGTGWHGRSLAPSEFAGDDGSADPALAEALAAFDRTERGLDGAASSPEPARLLAGAHQRVTAALGAARLLVPVVALPAGAEPSTPHGERHDRPHGSADAAQMALTTLRGPDGSLAVPAFTSLQALAAWRPDARPVPVSAQRLALAAVAEGATRVVIDPAGPLPYQLERPQLWALGQGQGWVPPEQDEQVRVAVDRVLAAADPQRLVRRTRLLPRPPAGLELALGLPGGLPQPTLQALTSAVADAAGADPVLTQRLDGLSLRLVPLD